jgi:DNA-binding NarL/FixJ family response regulator
VEGARAFEEHGGRLPGDAPVIVAADNQLARRRMSAALTLAGLPGPLRASSAREAAEAAGSEPVTIAFACDVSQPEGMAELRVLRKLAKGAQILVVSGATNASGVRRALDAGADGVVYDSELEAALAVSVHAVRAGQAVVPRRLRGGLQKPAFSHRERQVLGHVASGLTNSEIADALFLSESTVKSHLSSAFAKLGVRSRKEAAALVLDADQGLGVDLLGAGVPALAGVRTRGAS